MTTQQEIEKLNEKLRVASAKTEKIMSDQIKNPSQENALRFAEASKEEKAIFQELTHLKQSQHPQDLKRHLGIEIEKFHGNPRPEPDAFKKAFEEKLKGKQDLQRDPIDPEKKKTR